MSWNEITVLVERAKTGDREAYGELVAPVPEQRLRHGAGPGARPARGAGTGAGRVRPRDAEAAAAARRPVLRRLAAADHRADGDQPADPARPAVRGRSGAAGRRSQAHGRTAGGERSRSARRSASCKAGLAELKPLDRQTLEAFYLRGRSLKQMAREFDVPTGTIKRRLHVARQRLKGCWRGSTRPWRSGSRRTGELRRSLTTNPIP